MKVFKKKDFKKVNLDELVDADGSPISNQGKNGLDDTKNNQPNTTTQITAPDTGDAHAKLAIQPTRIYGVASSLGGFTPINAKYDTFDNVTVDQEPDKEKEEDIHSVKEGTEYIKKIVEDMLAKNKTYNSIIEPDNNHNGIPDINELGETKPEVVRNVEDFINNMSKTPLTDDESAIVLNYIVSNLKGENISTDYKLKLKGSI